MRITGYLDVSSRDGGCQTDPGSVRRSGMVAQTAGGQGWSTALDGESCGNRPDCTSGSRSLLAPIVDTAGTPESSTEVEEMIQGTVTDSTLGDDWPDASMRRVWVVWYQRILDRFRA